MHHRHCILDRLPADGCEMCRVLTESDRDAYARGWLDGVNGRPAAP